MTSFVSAFHSLRRIAQPVLFGLALTTFAVGQGPCTLDWQPGPAAAGPNGWVELIQSMSNGDVVAAGDFTVADSNRTNRIARWDGATWQPLGTGLASGTIHAMAELPNGNLVVGGSFTAIGGVTTRNLAVWNGSVWSSIGDLGQFAGNTVYALHRQANGDLIAGGSFSVAGGVAVDNVARWNGTSWSPLGVSLGWSRVRHLQPMPNGDLVAIGELSGPGFSISPFARWNGVAWSSVGNTGTVRAVTALPNGDLVIPDPNTTNRLNLYSDVGGWLQLVGFLTPPLAPSALGVSAGGELLVAGIFTGSASGGLVRYTGSSWPLVGTGTPSRIACMDVAANGDILTGGVDPSVHRFNGQSWTSLGAGPAPIVHATLPLPNGDVVISGQFSSLGGVAVNNIARWNGSTYVPFGAGVGGAVFAMALAPNGDLMVGGAFTTAGGAPAQNVARWNGSAWSNLGNGLAQPPGVMAVNLFGEVLVGGGGTIPFLRVWNGSVWTSLPAPGNALAMARTANGDILVGGGFGTHRYAAGSLQPFSTATHSVRRFATDHRGEVVAVGFFPSLNTRVARASGNAWLPLAVPAPVDWDLTATTFLPNGDLVVGGGIATVFGQPATGMAQFVGNSWRPLLGLQGWTIWTLAASETGTMFAGGSFFTAGNFVSAGLARAEPTCPASLATAGAGCSGGAGPVTLTAGSLPWAGATFRSTATGMTTPSLAAHVIGLQPTNVPLPSGAAGCALFVDPVLLDLLLPANGVVDAPVALPRGASVAGVVVRTQVVGIELDQAGAIVRLTSSNALELTVGAL
jgi:trimeric autotransporter adhesin